MTLIHIETSTNVCSVAISRDNRILWNRENHEGLSHSILLGKYVEESLDFARESGFSPDGVAVSCGPGSYTGLRIGVSTAKGVAYGLDLPLLSVNTLQVMANQVAKNIELDENTWLCPMIDARRMEVYTSFYDRNLRLTHDIQAEIIDENSFSEILKERKILCFGNGAEKCKKVLTHPDIEFIDGIHPFAKDMVELAEKAFLNREFQDVAYFEPFYLKEFVATTPKNKVI
jgi:tRNA threonylcarbamoyladenosine biosynthesis protein TsaB